MSGTLQADFLQPQSNTGLFILSPSGSTMATVNTAGIYSSTGAQMLNASGNFGSPTANTLVANTVTSNTVVIPGATSGSVSLVASAVAGTTTATLPAATGTVMVSGNMPAFSAYLNTTQSLTTSTTTKVQMNATVFDTASCFNTSTYRFTPTVAGYYQINYQAVMGGSNLTNMQAFIYKNGVAATSPYFYAPSVSSITNYTLTQSKLIVMNGTTDYLEFYVYISATSPSLVGDGSNIYTFANGFLARSA